MSTEVEVAVVGSGPHGLAAAVHLQARRPGRRQAGDLLVLDPTGDWLTVWDQRFAAYEIPCLRSPGVHNLDPDPYALIDFAARTGRQDELSPCRSVPSTALFADHCTDVIDRHGLGGAVTPSCVEAIEPQNGGASLRLTDGNVVLARHVVLAANPAIATIPPWAPRLGAVHAAEIDLAALSTLGGEHVLIVGGGLTAVHLAIGASRRGVAVTLVSRRPLVQRHFDTAPGWLGPKELDRFTAEPDPAVRRRLIDQARGGGTVPPRWLEALAATANIEITVGNPETITRQRRPDRLWAATGWDYDATSDVLVAGLRTRNPTPIHEGLPDLDRDLSWPGTNVHCLGAYAALRLGPTARNLAGAMVGAATITAAISGRRPSWLTHHHRQGASGSSTGRWSTPAAATEARSVARV